MTAQFKASDLEGYLLQEFKGERASWVGSSAGAAARCARHPGTPEWEYMWNDVDLFCSSPLSVISVGKSILDRGGAPASDDMYRKWQRALAWGEGNFHTMSIKMFTKDGVLINLVFKKVGNSPLRRIDHQIGSFDFSNVSMGVDLRTGRHVDAFPMFWYGEDPDIVRIFPDREDEWRNGNVTKHQGVRQAERYAINVDREYDMQACVEPLVYGYRIVGAHYMDEGDDIGKEFARLYLALADMIDEGRNDDLLELYRDVGPKKEIEKFAAHMLVAP